jgi:DNA mismatch repair protein MutS2
VVGLKNINFNLLKAKIDLNKMKSIDIIQEHMEYRLEKVSVEDEVPKDALNISVLLGLQDEVIDIAKEYYDER